MADGQTRKDVSRGERESDRAARADDIHEIATSLPEVTAEATATGLPVYQVRGKSFIFFRGRRKDAIDPDTGEPMDDVVGIRTPSEDDKFALVQAAGPWFTTPHFKRLPCHPDPAARPRRHQPRRAGRGHHRRLAEPRPEDRGAPVRGDPSRLCRAARRLSKGRRGAGASRR